MEHELEILYESYVAKELLNLKVVNSNRDLVTLIELMKQENSSVELDAVVRKIHLSYTSYGGYVDEFFTYSQTLEKLLRNVATLLKSDVEVTIVVRSASSGNMVVCEILDFVNNLLEINKASYISHLDLITLWHNFSSGSIVTPVSLNAMDNLSKSIKEKFNNAIDKLSKILSLEVVYDESAAGETKLVSFNLIQTKEKK